MINLDMAKQDPASVFKSPRDVLKEASLTREQKIDILRRWAYDQREIAVAEEENMQHPGHGGEIILDEILKTLLELGVETDQISSAPNKQGQGTNNE